MESESDPKLVWDDEFEMPSKKFVLVMSTDDKQCGDEIHQIVDKLGISKILIGDDSFYSLNIGSSYLNISTQELEGLYMMIGKALRTT